MCRVEERIYVSAEGHRSKFEEAFPCSKARRGRLCAEVQTRTTEYFPKKGVNPRDSTPSPINPPTPTGTGTYIVQQRRPSSSGSRPSTRDGAKIKPEIIINFSGKNKKGKGYVSVSTGAYKQSSDEIAVESPGSDASHTVRTGYPEAPLPPQAPVYGHSDAYNTIPTHGYHHRHTSSTSSYTGSSRTPSLLVTSDPDFDSPTTTRGGRLPPAIHYSSTAGAPLSPGKSHHGRSSSNDYNLTLVAPRDDYHDLGDRSASSHASSGASGSSRRRKDHDQTRKKNDEAEENAKQVRFDLGRAEGRAKERAESQLAEKEKQRAADREDIRQRKNREYEEENAKARRREELKPAKSSSSSAKPKAGSRRESISGMTPAQQKEHRRLLAAELGHMQVESKAADDREREERAALLRQQQQEPSYYNPRAAPMPDNASTMTRRNSTSRRDSFTAEARPTMLGRSNSRRTNTSQTNQPLISTQGAAGYMQAPSTRSHAPPPVSFPPNFNTRPTSARRSSISAQDNPFLAQTRISGTSLENPFATTPSIISPTIHQDPWDARNVREALPPMRQPADGRYLKASGTHSAARQASRAMARATGFEDDYATDSDDAVTHGHHRRRHGQ
jgi:hypothetical protein